MPDTVPDIFDVLADPTRRGILQLLRDRLGGGVDEVGVHEFVEELGVTRQSVNRHLAVLAQSGLVVSRDEGTVRSYALDTTPFEELEDWLAQFVGLAASTGSATDASAASGDGSTVFSAWSGADVGETIGRAIAERSYQARSAIREASEKLPKGKKKKSTQKSPKKS